MNNTWVKLPNFHEMFLFSQQQQLQAEEVGTQKGFLAYLGKRLMQSWSIIQSLGHVVLYHMTQAKLSEKIYSRSPCLHVRFQMYARMNTLNGFVKNIWKTSGLEFKDLCRYVITDPQSFILSWRFDGEFCWLHQVGQIESIERQWSYKFICELIWPLCYSAHNTNSVILIQFLSGCQVG